MEYSSEFSYEKKKRMTETVHFRLTKSEKDSLEKIAETREISLTDLMRNALQWYLVNFAGGKKK